LYYTQASHQFFQYICHIYKLFTFQELNCSSSPDQHQHFESDSHNEDETRSSKANDPNEESSDGELEVNEQDSALQMSEGNSDINEGNNDEVSEGNGIVTEEDNILEVSEENSDGELEANEGDHAINLNDCNLDTIVNLNSGLTARDILLLSLGLSVRHNWSYENLIDHLTCHNSLLDMPCLPRSKEKLWSVISNETSEIQYHAYCDSCYSYLGLKETLQISFPCINNLCKAVIVRSNVKYFITLSLRKQLQRFLSLPNIAEQLKYPHIRVKRNLDNGTLQDIFDGAVYKRLVREKIVDPKVDFTYIMNTDGVKILGGSKSSAYPLYIRINELPPSLRQKHLFLAAVWVDTHDPDMNCFLKPFVDEANNLSSVGVRWKPDGLNEICSKFIPLGQCVDSKARCALYNMNQFNGRNGCVVCDVDGVWSASNMRYPVLAPHGTSAPNVRTEENLVADMIAAETAHKVTNGVKGVSVLMNLNHFQMTSGCGMDDLHTLYEGCAKHHTELLMSLKGTTTFVMRESMINKRMKSMKTPSGISRKLGDITKRSSWKGSMWRNWLLFYGCVCMKDLIPQKYLDHFALLSHATFLMCEVEVHPQNFTLIRTLLLQYVKLFEQYFGINNMYYNIHLLLHFCESLMNLGPLWCYSTFNFESWNRKCVSLHVHAPKGAVKQIAYRHLIKQLVNYYIDSGLNVSSSTIEQLKSMLRKSRSITHSIGDVHFLGERTSRKPNDQERVLLEGAGFAGVEIFSEYPHVLYKSVLYSTADSVNRKGLSDDSVVYTWEDSICTIYSFVSFVCENNVEVGGVFLWEHYVESLSTAKHMARLTSNEQIFHFAQIDAIRCPVVIMPLAQEKYFGVLANCYEID